MRIRERSERAGHRIRRLAAGVIVTALAASGFAAVSSRASAAGGTYIVAPSGLATGDGSLAKPLSLEKALSSTSPVKPGDEILLRGGTYTKSYGSVIRGTATQPIVVRSYPGEWAVFDGNTLQRPSLIITGADIWFRDFEITKSDPKRISQQAGAGPTDISRGSTTSPWHGDGIALFAPRAKLINLVIHDTGNAIGYWDGADDAEVYGCILYNNGFLSTDRAWGHGMYIHSPTAQRSVNDVVAFQNWGIGLGAGVAEKGDLVGLSIQGSTSFENGAPVGMPWLNFHVGPHNGILDRITFRDNVGYYRTVKGDNARLGFASEAQLKQNGTVSVENNALMGGRAQLVLQGWKNATVRGNLFSSAPGDPGSSDMIRMFTNQYDGGSYQLNDNTYVDTNTASSTYAPAFARFRKVLGRWTGGRLTFPNWMQVTGYDGASAFGRTTTPGTRVLVRPNRYETGRAVITVLNHAKATTVWFDPATAGIQAGQRFEIRDVQNLTGAPLVTGIYDGSPVAISMTSTEVMQPIGGSPVPVRHTPVDFGVFQARAIA